jgi:hypothetical protein
MRENSKGDTMTEQELDDATRIGIYRAVLFMDAVAREQYEHMKKTSAHKFIEAFTSSPDVKEIPDGFVFDPFANHALFYYCVGLADEVRCVGRFLDSGLAMKQAEDFGK